MLIYSCSPMLAYRIRRRSYRPIDGPLRTTFLGYAVECAIKACVARQFRQDEVPDKTIVNDFYTHRLDKLLGISGAKAALESRTSTDAAFQVNWNTVRDWNESARYDHSITEAKARDMLVAVSDPNSGVLPWLKTQW